jgi:uncharacterized protein (TIGR03435 family)
MKAMFIIGALFSAILRGQPAPPAAPKWEVVSVKTCKPGVMVPGGSSPGRLHIGCGILANTDNTGLIQVAYNRYASGRLTSANIIPIEGGPDWIHSETFEIDATSEAHPAITMMEGPMMQKILEDRFNLKIHRETRQGPVYELTLGKGALKLKPFKAGSCIPVRLGQPMPPVAAPEHYCRDLVSPVGVDFEGGTLSMMAGLLNLILDRPVIDETGVTDYFEIHLKFSPDDSTAPRVAATDPGSPAVSNSPDAPGIFQAIQEQLGLKLAPARGPVDVLVIDHIEKPSEN